jgi:hypothetical protein
VVRQLTRLQYSVPVYFMANSYQLNQMGGRSVPVPLQQLKFIDIALSFLVNPLTTEHTVDYKNLKISIFLVYSKSFCYSKGIVARDFMRLF